METEETQENPFAYMEKMHDEERAYSGRMDHWLIDTFLNTSAASRNNRPWFRQRISDTFQKQFGDKPVVIGITGLAGSGKDSAINYLNGHEWQFYDFETKTNLLNRRLAFADPLKQIAEIVGFTKHQLTDRECKEMIDPFWGISPRQFLQMCGTEMFRKVWRDDAWVKMTLKRIEKFETSHYVYEKDGKEIAVLNRFIFVTDVRFPNEAQALKEIGGYIVRVERPNNPNHISEKHDSERFVESLPVDLTIVNDCKSAEEWGWKFAKDLTHHFDQRAFY